MAKFQILPPLRDWLEENPHGEWGTLRRAFSKVDIKTLEKTLEYLKKRGELVVFKEYSYYGHKHGNEDREVKQTAIWRVIRSLAKVSRIVTWVDVLTLSEASKSYAERYVRFLETNGYVAVRASGIAVLEKAMRQAETPHFNQRKNLTARPSASGATEEGSSDGN